MKVARNFFIGGVLKEELLAEYGAKRVQNFASPSVGYSPVSVARTTMDV